MIAVVNCRCSTIYGILSANFHAASSVRNIATCWIYLVSEERPRLGDKLKENNCLNCSQKDLGWCILGYNRGVASRLIIGYGFFKIDPPKSTCYTMTLYDTNFHTTVRLRPSFDNCLETWGEYRILFHPLLLCMSHMVISDSFSWWFSSSTLTEGGVVGETSCGCGEPVLQSWPVGLAISSSSPVVLLPCPVLPTSTIS